MTDDDRPEGKAGGAAAKVAKTPPASLTAALIQRTHDDWNAIDGAPPAQSALPTPEAAPGDVVIAPASPDRAATAETVEQTVDARAQQVILAEAFGEPQAAGVTLANERAELQSARESAESWSQRSGPPAVFWERLARDVSIFTIVFAVLVFGILQTM